MADTERGGKAQKPFHGEMEREKEVQTQTELEIYSEGKCRDITDRAR
jgi:hypothetical protein